MNHESADSRINPRTRRSKLVNHADQGLFDPSPPNVSRRLRSSPAMATFRQDARAILHYTIGDLTMCGEGNAGDRTN